MIFFESVGMNPSLYLLSYTEPSKSWTKLVRVSVNFNQSCFCIPDMNVSVTDSDWQFSWSASSGTYIHADTHTNYADVLIWCLFHAVKPYFCLYIVFWLICLSSHYKQITSDELFVVTADWQLIIPVFATLQGSYVVIHACRWSGIPCTLSQLQSVSVGILWF